MSATKEVASAEVRLADRIAVNEAEAAELLGFCRDTLRRYRREGTGPVFARVGGAETGPVRYLVADLRTWIEASRWASRAQEIAANGIGGAA